jgi:hypothetical protein
VLVCPADANEFFGWVGPRQVVGWASLYFGGRVFQRCFVLAGFPL